MPEYFSLVVNNVGDVHLAALYGELDVTVSKEVARQLIDVAGSTVVADLKGLTFIDASGITALLTAKEEIEAGGNALVIRGAMGMVRRLFSTLQLDDILSQ